MFKTTRSDYDEIGFITRRSLFCEKCNDGFHIAFQDHGHANDVAAAHHAAHLKHADRCLIRDALGDGWAVAHDGWALCNNCREEETTTYV